MAEKELRKMSRTELIEVIYALQQEGKTVEEEKKALEAKLAQRTIQLSESGSIAEAAVKINKIFESAQAAADQYLESVRAANAKAESRSEQILEEAGQKADRILEDAQKRADMIRQEAEVYRERLRKEGHELLAQANRAVDEKWNSFDKRVQSYLEKYSELNGFLKRNDSERHIV